MLILQGGRGDMTVSVANYEGRKMVVFCKHRGKPIEPGHSIGVGTIDWHDCEFAFESDDPGSFLALGECALTAARTLKDEQSGLSKEAVVRCVAAVRKGMLELGYQVDDLKDEYIEDLMREFTFTGEEEFVKECVDSAAAFIKDVEEAGVAEIAELREIIAVCKTRMAKLGAST